jgi:hypothetical protein
MHDRTRLIGLYAVFAAAASFVLAPLLGLAYFGTEEGADELATPSVAAWAEPARDAVGPLLTFAAPDRVYSTYLQALALCFPAIVLCAWIARRRRPRQDRRLERWGWRIAFAGYLMLVTGLLGVSLVLVAGSPSNPAVNVFYLALVFPGILLATTGSTALGIALLRSDYRPRLTAWVLALVFPLWVVGDFVIGYNGIGLVPLLVAWGVTGRELARRSQHPAPASAALS